MLRPGNSTANDAADHAAVIEEALAQIPDGHRHGTPILVRADSAGGTRGFLGYLRSLRDQRGLDVSFSIGFRVTNTVSDAIRLLPETAWTVAIDTDGTPRPIDGTGLPVAQIAELTGMLGDPVGNGWPAGMRVLVRRERPHPGAQITLLEAHDGWRYQAVATDTRVGQLAWLEARHRAHAWVEDKIRNLKQTGIGRFPSRDLPINQNLAAARVDRGRPDRLDPDHPPDQRPGQGRAQDAALPAAARRRPPDTRATPNQNQNRPSLALGASARRRIQPACPDLPATAHLNR